MDISDQDWYKEALSKWLKEYGEVPPPWVYRPNSHPYSIGWRMGAGESFLMVFWQWWEDKSFSEAEALAFFKKHTPPPRWLGWVCESIWELDGQKALDDDYEKEFIVLEANGFEGTQNYISDLEDPKWLDTNS